MPYKAFERDNEWCVYKLEGETPTGDTFGCHPTQDQANEQVRALYANENMTTEFVYLPEEFVGLKPGNAFRVLPFGKLVKNGIEHIITPEFAKRFKLPHFKPPIKLGSHKEETPAGGFVRRLEVGEDGLYAVPELTDAGAMAFERGDYRYHSPEIIWENGGYEDPISGENIRGPMIVGIALLHTPHLGNAAALYNVNPLEVKNMTIETVEVPKTIWERVENLFKAEKIEKAETATKKEEEPKGDEMIAIVAERDNYKAQLNEMQAQFEAQKLHAAITAQLGEDRFGAHFDGATDAVDMLASMTQDQRDWVLQKFAALIAQVKESNLTGEIGSDGGGADTDGVAELHKLINQTMTEKRVDFNTALQVVMSEHPDLVSRAY